MAVWDPQQHHGKHLKSIALHSSLSWKVAVYAELCLFHTFVPFLRAHSLCVSFLVYFVDLPVFNTVSSGYRQGGPLSYLDSIVLLEGFLVIYKICLLVTERKGRWVQVKFEF